MTHVHFDVVTGSLRVDVIPVDCTVNVDQTSNLATLVESYEASLEVLLDEVIANLTTGALNSDLVAEETDCVTLRGSPGGVCGCGISCGLGNLVADAVAAYGDVGLTKAGLFEADLEATVTRRGVLEVLPDLRDEIVLVTVTGENLRTAISESIADLSVDAVKNGTLLQVSKNLSGTWSYLGDTPTLTSLLLKGAALIDTNEYNVALPSSIAAGLLKASSKTTPLGVSQYDAVVDYLLEAQGNIDSEQRIAQAADVQILNVAVLCATNELARREHCDHLLFTIDRINDKTDGYLDDVLPHVRIVPYAKETRCAEEDTALEDFIELATSEMPSPVSAVFMTCSGDVKRIADPTTRDHFKSITGQQSDYVVVATASSLASLEDDQKYPYLARLATSDAVKTSIVAKVVRLYKWSRIAVIYDDTDWAVGSAESLALAFRNDDESPVTLLGDGVCVPSDCILVAEDDGEVIGIPMSRLALDGDPESVMNDVMDEIEAKDARIIFIASYTQGQREFFGRWFQRRGQREANLKGYGIITNLPSLASVVDEAGVVDVNAVYGQQGTLGFTEHYPSASESRAVSEYIDAWTKAMPRLGNCDTTASTPYYTESSILGPSNLDVLLGTTSPEQKQQWCDSDGDPSTLDGFGPLWIDAAVMWAKALETVADLTDAGAVYDAIKSTRHDGVSGLVVLSQDTGDRANGKLQLLNFQVTPPDDFQLFRRLSSVELTGTSASYVATGEYDPLTGVTIGNDIQFPGNTAEVPPDQSSDDDDDNKKVVGQLATIIVIVFCVTGGLILFCWCWNHRRQRKIIKRQTDEIADLEAAITTLKDDAVSMLAVTHDYDPRRRQEGLVPRATAPATLVRWYWEEDVDRVKDHNPHMVKGNWIEYAGSVASELEDVYQAYIAGRGPSTFTADLTDRISSTGTERKAHGQTTGQKYLVDVVQMTQTNIHSDYTRKILRCDDAAPKTSSKGGPTWLASVFASKEDTKIEDDKGSIELSVAFPVPPEDLLASGEPLLILRKGALVQVTKNRPDDDWCFGSVILTPDDDDFDDSSGCNSDVVTDGDTGWFPQQLTDVPDQGSLRRLALTMGNAVDLHAPDHWDVVKDPQVAETILLSDGDEKTKVLRSFFGTLDAKSINVKSVHRIQNVAMWQTFAVKRQTVVARETDTHHDASRFEKVWLFHGTNEAVSTKIIQQGFNRSFCGKNATAYGKGVYFARDAHYSANRTYAVPNSAGLQFIFLCRVVVGEYCRGKKDALVPDVRDVATDRLYDSTVDNMTNPSLYVTYHDAQAYPEYLIAFSQT